MRRFRPLPEQGVMRDLYRTHPGTCESLGELTEAAMRGPSPFTQAQRAPRAPPSIGRGC
jgi:hypothetical protein